MVVPDIIISWPDNADYPLWRKFLIQNRKSFNEVIIVFTSSHRKENYVDFVRQQLEQHHCQFIIPMQTRGNEDWRHNAVKQALIHSYNAPWVWFTEQDFIVPDWERFMTVVDSAQMMGHDVIALYEGERMHPACIFIRREILNRTSRQFGIIPNKADHFYTLQADLETLGVDIFRLENHKNKKTDSTGLCFHMAGATHNMNLVVDGGRPCYEITRFNRWIAEALADPIEKHPQWVRDFTTYINSERSKIS